MEKYTCPKCGSNRVSYLTPKMPDGSRPRYCLCDRCHWQGTREEARPKGEAEKSIAKSRMDVLDSKSVMKAWDKMKLHQKQVSVKRGGKTFQRRQWVGMGEKPKGEGKGREVSMDEIEAHVSNITGSSQTDYRKHKGTPESLAASEVEWHEDMARQEGEAYPTGRDRQRIVDGVADYIRRTRERAGVGEKPKGEGKARGMSDAEIDRAGRVSFRGIPRDADQVQADKDRAKYMDMMRKRGEKPKGKAEKSFASQPVRLMRRLRLLAK